MAYVAALAAITFYASQDAQQRVEVVDVLVLKGAADDAPALVRSMQPSIVVTSAPIEPLDSVTVVEAQPNAVELLFDGAQWKVRALP